MRGLLAENLDKASTTRTVAAITEHNVADNGVYDDGVAPDTSPTPAAQGKAPAISAEVAAAPATSTPAPASRTAVLAQAAAAVPPAQPRVDPAPLTSGVIQTQPLPVVPGASEPMKPVRVKTVQVKAGVLKLASASPSQPTPPVTSAIPARPEVAETSGAVVAKAESAKAEAAQAEAPRTDLPPQPPGFGTGNGVLGVLPASSVAAGPPRQAMAYAAPAPQPVAQPQPQAPAVQQTSDSKPPILHTGWIVQVGALESEGEAQQRIEAARNQAHGLLSKADPFTEPVIAKGDRKLFRARFAGLDRDQAEAVCRTLRRSDISCITVKN
jgi:D-alanyl-D-alanine carboxypeptidase